MRVEESGIAQAQPARFVMLHGLTLVSDASSRHFNFPFIIYSLANNLFPLLNTFNLPQTRTIFPTLLLQDIVPIMADNSSAKSLADPVLLETIDKLFQHNIGEYVSLPQVGLLILEQHMVVD